jgi:hypothetical protein
MAARVKLADTSSALSERLRILSDLCALRGMDAGSFSNPLTRSHNSSTASPASPIGSSLRLVPTSVNIQIRAFGVTGSLFLNQAVVTAHAARLFLISRVVTFNGGPRFPVRGGAGCRAAGAGQRPR